MSAQQQTTQELTPSKTPSKTRSKFSKEEDQAVLELYKTHPNDWKFIADKLNRSIRQVRERYQHFLAPHLNKSPWTDEEELLLYQKVEELGTVWAKISSFFPNRSTVNIKNHWSTMMNRRFINKRKRRLLPFEITAQVENSQTDNNPLLLFNNFQEFDNNQLLFPNFQEFYPELKNVNNTQTVLPFSNDHSQPLPSITNFLQPGDTQIAFQQSFNLNLPFFQ